MRQTKKIPNRASLSVAIGSAALVFVSMVSCGYLSTSKLQSESTPSHWNEPATPEFISKAYRTLVYRGTITPQKMKIYQGKSRREVVDELLKDPGFVTTSLDFALHFHNKTGSADNSFSSSTGASGDGFVTLKTGSLLNSAVRASLAVAKASNNAAAGDQHAFFDLIRLDKKPLIGKLNPTKQHEMLFPELKSAIDERTYTSSNPKQRRTLLWGVLLAALERAAGESSTCKEVQAAQNLRFIVPNAMGVDEVILPAAVFDDAEEAFSSLASKCSGTPDARLSAEEQGVSRKILDKDRFFKGKWEALTDRGERERDWYLNLIENPFKTDENPFGQRSDWLSFFITNTNSSTNGNRKRSSAILKTYFCDDLSPLNVVAPAANETHSTKRHASDPSCQACHYRLDPMAGFFKNHGAIGTDFITDPNYSGNKKLIEDGLRRTLGAPGQLLIFDDQAVLEGEELRAYLAQWRQPEGKTGFIRSLTDTSLNFEGDTLVDLERIIETAPEVKRCIAQRMIEYYVGPNQSVPGEWKESLAKKLSVSRSESAKAYVDTVREIVLSKTFAVSNPEKGVCYEDDGSGAKSGIPCDVQYLLQRNCVQCHSSNVAAGGLALDRMGKLSDGSSNFAHSFGTTKCQQSRAQTFDALLKSLTTTDENKRMPLMKHMDALDREKLIRWATEQAASEASKEK